MDKKQEFLGEGPQEVICREDDETLYCRVCERRIKIVKTSKYTELQHMRSLVHIQNLQSVFIKYEKTVTKEQLNQETTRPKIKQGLSEIRKQIKKDKQKQAEKKEKKLNSINHLILEIKEKLEILLQNSCRFKDLNKSTRNRYIIVIQNFFQEIGKSSVTHLTQEDVLAYLETNNTTRVEAPLKFLMHEMSTLLCYLEMRFNEEQKLKIQHLKLQRVINNQSLQTKLIRSYDQHFQRFLIELYQNGKMLVFVIVFLIYYYHMNVEQILKYKLIDLKKLGAIKHSEYEPKFMAKNLQELIEMLQSQIGLSDDQYLVSVSRRDVTRIFSNEVKIMEQNCTDSKYKKFLSQFKLVQIKQVVKQKLQQKRIHQSPSDNFFAESKSEDESEDESQDFEVDCDSQYGTNVGKKEVLQNKQNSSSNSDCEEIIINLTQEDIQEIVKIKSQQGILNIILQMK